MRTAKECLLIAAKMDATALTCPANYVADYQRMAFMWRQLARDAQWQDGFPHLVR
jgi:hypothetical protein